MKLTTLIEDVFYTTIAWLPILVVLFFISGGCLRWSRPARSPHQRHRIHHPERHLDGSPPAPRRRWLNSAMTSRNLWNASSGTVSV